MPAIKPVGSIAEKWGRVTPTRTQDYAEGVASPRADWEKATSEAQGAYNDGVQKSIAAGSFSKGVKKTGTAGWKEATEQKGVPRWGQGVQIGQGSYEKGFAPFATAIERTALPPRFAKGDPRNLERVKKMNEAVRSVKTAQK